MKNQAVPHGTSYEASLTEEQRAEFHAVLLSGITLAEARDKAWPWPTGPEQGHKPSLACMGRIRLRLRLAERVARIQEIQVIRRATRDLLRRLANKQDQETVLDEAMALIGQQVIDAALDPNGGASKFAAAWLLLRRADQRRFDQRTAIFKDKAAKAKAAPEAKPAEPPMTEEEQDAAWRQIFGMEPR